MNLYRVTAEAMGMNHLIIRAKTSKQAAEIAWSAIYDLYRPEDPVKQEVVIEELCPPEGAGCYLASTPRVIKTDKFSSW